MSRFTTKLKELMKALRDSISKCVEVSLIMSLNLLPRFYFQKERLITLTHRAGRGRMEPQADAEMFGTIPKSFRMRFKHMHYNSQLWILDAIVLIFYLLKYRNLKIILIQYVPNYTKFPSIKLLTELNNRGVEIIKVWPDSWNKTLWDKRILPMSHIGKKNILLDIPENSLIPKNQSNNYSWYPPPIATFPYKRFKERENFLFYSGGVSHEGIYKPRGEYLEFLKAHGFPVSGVAYNRDTPIERPSYISYRNDLSNSKIGLNFTWKDNVDIITGRTWEIFSSGALLLQNSAKILDGLFVEGTHYVAFTSKEDLLFKVKFLSENPIRSETIAQSGLLRYKEVIDAEKFWLDIIQ